MSFSKTLFLFLLFIDKNIPPLIPVADRKPDFPTVQNYRDTAFVLFSGM
jgi:hypothetical protein